MYPHIFGGIGVFPIDNPTAFMLTVYQASSKYQPEDSFDRQYILFQ